MSGAPRIRSVNVTDLETRKVLGPAGNKAGLVSPCKPGSKPLHNPKSIAQDVKSPEEAKSREGKKRVNQFSPVTANSASVLSRHEKLLHTNLSLNASCSSDASTESFHIRASTGRLMRSSSMGSRRKPGFSKSKSTASDGSLDSPSSSGSPVEEMCLSHTINRFFEYRTMVIPFQPAKILQSIHLVAELRLLKNHCYAAFHEEEWGVPVHDDKKLFELLVLSGALAELTWPSILSRRHTFREVFANFDPIAVSKFCEKKLAVPGNPPSSLLSEPRLRAVIKNARQITKVIEEFGSFDKYIWSFVNNKRIVSRFGYPRQVPVKSPKADVISKDLVRRGFQSVGPFVVYSFMQAAGLTNDHLISCFRFEECLSSGKGKDYNKNEYGNQTMKANDASDSELCSAVEWILS